MVVPLKLRRIPYVWPHHNILLRCLICSLFHLCQFLLGIIALSFLSYLTKGLRRTVNVNPLRSKCLCSFCGARLHSWITFRTHAQLCVYFEVFRYLTRGSLGLTIILWTPEAINIQILLLLVFICCSFVTQSDYLFTAESTVMYPPQLKCLH